MKLRRALLALGIFVIAVAVVAVARRSMRRTTRVPPSASARATAKSLPVLSASAPPLAAASVAPPAPERPAYLDTTATTLAEQRAALFTNMRSQLDLPPGAQDKIEAIFAASNWL